MGYTHTTGKIEISDHIHAWRDKDGFPHAAVDLGALSVTVDSAEEARAIAARFAEAAGKIEALPPAERAS